MLRVCRLVTHKIFSIIDDFIGSGSFDQQILRFEFQKKLSTLNSPFSTFYYLCPHYDE